MLFRFHWWFSVAFLIQYLEFTYSVDAFVVRFLELGRCTVAFPTKSHSLLRRFFYGEVVCREDVEAIRTVNCGKLLEEKKKNEVIEAYGGIRLAAQKIKSLCVP